MPIIVSFCQPGRLAGSATSVGIGRCRIRETLTLGSGVTTTAAAQAGEIAIVHSTETAAVLGAKGTAPDAAAAVVAAGTDAGFPVGPGQITPVEMGAGEKLNFKPLA